MRRSMLMDTWTARAGCILLAALLVGSCGLMETSGSKPAAPVSQGQEWCGFDQCYMEMVTPSGRIAIGEGWDEGATGSGSYHAVWVVRNGKSTKTALTRGEEDVGLPFLASWGDGAMIIATRTGAGGEGLSWVTRDGTSWKGPTPFRVPGEGVFMLRPEFVWDSRIVITGQQCIDDRWVNSIWTSADGVTWHLADSPREGADFAWIRLGGDGIVVDLEVYALPSGSSTKQAWEWTTADLVHWRPLSSPYPCCENFEPWGPRYGCEDGVLEP